MEKDRPSDNPPISETFSPDTPKKRRARKASPHSAKKTRPETPLAPPAIMAEDYRDILTLPKEEKVKTKDKAKPSRDEAIAAEEEVETDGVTSPEPVEVAEQSPFELIAVTSEEIYDVPLDSNADQVILLRRSEQSIAWVAESDESSPEPLPEIANPPEIADDQPSPTPEVTTEPGYEAPPPPEGPDQSDAAEPPDEPPPLPWQAPDNFRPSGPSVDPNLRSGPDYSQPSPEIPPHSHANRSDGPLWFFIGNLWQRHKRNQLEKRINRALNKQTKRTNKLEKTQQNTNLEVKQLASKPDVVRPPKPLAKPEQLTVIERVVALKTPEQKKVPSLIELPADAQAIAEQLSKPLPQQHRLEHSAWHTIEVDKKTGRVVEQPVFEYGQEFQREVRQETWQPDDEVAVASGQLAVGGVTSVGVGGSVGGGSGSQPVVASVVNRLDRLESSLRGNSGLQSNLNDIVLAGVLVIILITILVVSLL